MNVGWTQSIANYAFTTNATSSLTDMSSGETSLLTAATYHDDDASAVTNIGFTFVYMGVPYTQFSINSNGQLRLGSTVITGVNYSTPTAITTILAPMAGDNAIKATGRVAYKVTGTAGSKVLTVSWEDFTVPFSSTNTGATMQLRLYETTGIIEFVYGNMYCGTSSTTRSIFLGSSNTATTNGFITVSPATFTPSATNTTNTFATVGAITNLSSATDGSRIIYTFTPPALPTTPTNLTFSSIGVTSMILNWTDSPDELSYAIFRSTDGVNYTYIAPLVTNTVTYTATGLTSNTLYYWKVVALNEGKGAELLGSQTTNTAVPLHGVYSINNTLPTSSPLLHNGTDNFASFTAAINALNDNGISAAVTVNVTANQSFVEDCPVVTVSGTSANTITFVKSGAGANPIIQPTGGAGSTDAGIIIHGGDYITFNGIDITINTGSAVEYGYLIRNASATDGAQRNVVINSKITLNRTSTSSRAIYQNVLTTPTAASGANSFNTYRKNTIENTYSGIYLTGNVSYPDSTCIIDSNIVGASTANDIGGGSSASNGIRTTYQSGITIANNIVRNVSTTAAAVYGIYLESALGTNNIYNNKIYSIGTTSTSTSNLVYGLRTDINATYTTNVFNNMISNLNHGITTASATQVIRAMAIGVSGTGTGNFSYNSVLISASASASSTAFYCNNGIANLRNNIFANASTAGATSKRYCIYRNGGTINSDNNDLFIATGTNNFVGYFTTDQATLANWRTASTNQDLASISVDPTFVSATDLHTTNSALNGVGTPVSGITVDIDGDLRDLIFPDMGADENLTTPSFTCVTPTPGNTVSSLNPICNGNTILLSTQNATTGTGVTYQWKSSADGISYSNGPTTSTWSVVPTAATFYQCEVTCHAGPSTATSTPLQVTFSNNVLTTTPGARCGTGIVDLGATGSAGSTLKWYAASTGGSSLYSGSPYSANVSSTSTYYVGAENSTPANITLGLGALTNTGFESPFNHSWGGMKSQYLVKASELIAAGLSAGNITALSFNIAAPGAAYNTFNLSLGSTALIALTTTIQTGLTSVYSAASVTPTAGVFTITFGTPYLWDGTSNIIVETCWSNNNTGGTGTTVKYDNSGFVATSYYRNDSQTAAALCGATTATATLSTRPQMIFAGVSTCSSPRTAVIATVNTAPALTVSADQTVCNNAIAPISVTTPLANYDTYVWTPAAGLFTDAAATTAYVAGASATTVYAKTVTASITNFVCTASNALLCAKTDTAIITVLPATPVITAVSSPICVTGTSALNVTPATNYGAATFQWNISTDNVSFAPISGHASLTDITGVLTATTYYKLTIMNGTGATCVEPTVAVNVVNPQIVSTTPATRCGTGPVTVGATGSADVNFDWYNQAVAGTNLWTGATYTTTISTDTNFYVQAFANTLLTCKSARTAVHVTMTPAPVLTLSATQTVCNNAIATISVTSTLADYNAYTWTPVTNLYTDAAATVAYVAGASASTVYVKSPTSGANVYTCSASNAALCANIATSTVIVRSAINITAVATPSSICAGGSSDLVATASQPFISQSVPLYVFSTLTNVYTPLVGGTTSTATGDDGTQLAIPIGFDFTYNGSSFSTFSISTNGTIRLGATAVGYSNGLASFANVLAPFWDDNNIGSGTISYLVSGIAPNRVLTVDWNNVSIGGSGSSSASTNQYQVQLFEGTNNVQFNYGPLDASNGTTASIGISGNVGQFISLTPDVATTTSTVTENSTISSVANIPSGTSYLFTSNEVHSFTYSWKAGATQISTALTTTVSPSANTDYTFTVLDGNSCSVTSPIVTVSVSPVLVALTPVNVTCNGGNNGSFTPGAITCGTAPFTYSVDGGAFGPIPTNLIAGPHPVIVKDAGLNVSATVNLVLTQPAAIEIPVAGSPVVVCQGATSAIVSATTSLSVSTTTITVPFDVTVQPTETNATPGNIIATATLPAIPAGSTITSATLTYPGITANGGSWQADVRLGLSGAVTNTAAISTGAPNTTGLLNYSRIITAPTVNLAGGAVNLLYWDNYDDVAGGDDATFTLGVGVATLSITYNSPATVTWYNAATAGTVIGNGTTLETIGTTVLPNGNTPGTYNFYAEGSYATCISATRSLVSVTISAPSVGGTVSAPVDNVCSGTATIITLAGSTGSIQWQSSSNGTTWNDVAGQTSATLATGNLTAKTYYKAIVTSGTCASATSTIDSVGVIATPIPGTLAGEATVCSNANSTLLTLTGYTGTITRWESSLDGTTWTPITNTSDTYTATNLAVTTHFKVVVENGICSSNSNHIMVTVTPLPTAVIFYAGAPFCSSNAVEQTVTLVGTTGGLYSSTTGLTIVGGTGAITPSTSTPGSYVVTYTIAAAGGCAVVSDDTTIVITTAPTANITYAGSPFINNVTTPQAVTFTGSTGGVYSALPTGLTLDASTGAIIPSTSTVGNYVVTYTIAAASGCGTVTDTANVVINAPATCNAPTALVVTAINASGASLNWTAGGTETAWNLRYKRVADATYINVTNTTIKPYILTALQPSTAYVWNVQAVCSSSLTSPWSVDNTFNTTVGISSSSLSGLNVYSVNNQINVINNDNLLVKEVVVYDVLGKEVAKYAINSTDNVLINTNFSVANYIVKVVTDTQVGTYKLFIK